MTRFKWHRQLNNALWCWLSVATLLYLVLVVLVSIIVSSLAYGLFLDYPLDDVRPWSIFEYHIFSALSPRHGMVFWLSLAVPAGLTAALPVAALVANLARTKTHGDARFSGGFSQRKAGLYSAEGLILGRAGTRLLRADKNTNVGVVAPPRSGKGLGIVMPNVLAWPGSVVVTDLKQEVWDATAGFRARYGEAHLFAPGETHTSAFNSLDLIRRDPRFRVADIQQIAHILMPTPLQGNPMWESEARSLYLAIVLLLLDTPEATVSNGAAYRLAKGPELSEEGLAKLLRERGATLDPVCAGNLNDYLVMGDRQKSGVKSSLMTALEVFADPLVDAATSHSDFDPRQLFDRRMAIYLGVKPANLKRLATIFNLFIQQLVLDLVRDLSRAESAKNHVLLLLDEGPAFGRMDAIKQSAAFFPGYNVRLLFIMQALSQLDSIYGEAGRRELVGTFRHRVFFAPNDANEAHALSRELGNTTVRTRSLTMGSGWASRSSSQSSTGRPLLSPDEVMRLPPKYELILTEGARPTRALKFNYLKDKRFTCRLLPTPQVPKLVAAGKALNGLWREPIDEPLHTVYAVDSVDLTHSHPVNQINDEVIDTVASVFGISSEEVRQDGDFSTGWIYAT